MTEAIRTTPTVCYLEVPGSMMPQRAAFESDRCRVMAVASTFYGTLDEQGQWHDNGEPRDKWWDGEIDKVLAVWEAQGWDDRLALRFDWFEDKRLPKGTQAAFSARIAERVGPVLKAHGARIDFMFADNEQDIPSTCCRGGGTGQTHRNHPMNKHVFWRGIICGVTLGFVITAARADTKTLTIDPFTIDGVSPAVVHFAESNGPGLFQAVYKAEVDGPDILIECREGFPCTCRPLGQFQSYNLWTAESVDLGLDPASTSVSFSGNTITLTDAQPIRVHPGDFNGDGATSVQDIFDFLVTQPTPGEVFAFLEAWYS